MAKIEIKDLDRQKKQLLASFRMWEKTIKETVDNMKNARNDDGRRKYTDDQIADKVELLKNGEQDIIEKWVFLGGSIDELIASTEKSTKPVVKKKNEFKTVMDKINDLSNTNTEVDARPKVKKIDRSEPIRVQAPVETPSNVIPKADESNPMASYDIIPLPSKGECYPNKQGRIAVSYLTAIDENIIVSPNLYRDNMVLDIILKEKIRNTEIDPDDLLDGDRDAIILFLRSSAYGNMYSVTATDPETKKSFDTEIDLSKLKYRDFTLTGDENGFFDFKTPVKGDDIKFRFLTHRDYINLNKLDQDELYALRKGEIEKYNEKLNDFLDSDDNLTSGERLGIVEAISTLGKWAESYDGEPITYSHRATNELEMEIMSINGNTDRMFIHNYVQSMPIRDSAALRKYIAKNTPGVDYNFEIEKPQSLGGGSMKVFLQLDQFIFLVDTI